MKGQTQEEPTQTGSSGQQQRKRSNSVGNRRTPINTPQEKNHTKTARANTRSASRKQREEKILKGRDIDPNSSMEDVEEVDKVEVTSLGQLAEIFHSKFEKLPTKNDMNHAISGLEKRMDKKPEENA